MEGNRDWKVPAALILAGLALLIAFSGRTSLPFFGGEDQPRQTILIQNSPPGSSAQVIPTPYVAPVQPNVPVAPVAPVAPHFGWDYGRSYGFGAGAAFFKCLVFALLLFLVFKLFSRRRWQAYAGGYGPGQWRGPTPPPPPTQGPPPGQGPGHWEWRPDSETPPARASQAENHGDIMRPGEGDQE